MIMKSLMNIYSSEDIIVHSLGKQLKGGNCLRKEIVSLLSLLSFFTIQSLIKSNQKIMQESIAPPKTCRDGQNQQTLQIQTKMKYLQVFPEGKFKNSQKMKFKVGSSSIKQMNKYLSFPPKKNLEFLTILIQGFNISFNEYNSYYFSHLILGSSNKKCLKSVLRGFLQQNEAQIVIDRHYLKAEYLILLLFPRKDAQNCYSFQLYCYSSKGRLILIWRNIGSWKLLIKIIMKLEAKSSNLIIKMMRTEVILKGLEEENLFLTKLSNPDFGQSQAVGFKCQNSKIVSLEELNDIFKFQTLQMHLQQKSKLIQNQKLRQLILQIQQISKALIDILSFNLGIPRLQCQQNQITLRVFAFYFNEIMKSQQRDLTLINLTRIHKKIIAFLIHGLQQFKNQQKLMQNSHLIHYPVLFKKFHLKCYGCKAKRVKISCFGCSKIQGKLIPLCLVCFPKYHANLVVNAPVSIRKSDQPDDLNKKIEQICAKWANLQDQVLQMIKQQTLPPCKIQQIQ